MSNKNYIPNFSINSYFYTDGNKNNVLYNIFRDIYNVAKQNNEIKDIINKYNDEINNKLYKTKYPTTFYFPENFDYTFHLCIFLINTLELFSEFRHFKFIIDIISEYNRKNLYYYFLKLIFVYLIDIRDQNNNKYIISKYINTVLVPLMNGTYTNLPAMIPRKIKISSKEEVYNNYYKNLRLFYTLISNRLGINRNVLSQINNDNRTIELLNDLDKMNIVIQNVIEKPENLVIPVIRNQDQELNEALRRSTFETRLTSEYITHIDINSNTYLILNNKYKENKLNIYKNIIYNLCGFIFHYNNKIKILDLTENKTKYFYNVNNSNDKKLVEMLKYQMLYSFYFELNIYHYFNSIIDNVENDFDKSSFIKLIKNLNHLDTKIHIDNVKSIERYIKSHIPYFLFFFIEKRKHYIENNMKSDLINLKKCLNDPSHLNIDDILNCVKDSVNTLDKLREEFFKQKYQTGENKNCYIFFCSICSITECDPDESDPDERNDSFKFFTVLNCGHSLHRECARDHSKSNSQSKVITSLSTNYVRCSLCLIECPMCRTKSYIYY